MSPPSFLAGDHSVEAAVLEGDRLSLPPAALGIAGETAPGNTPWPPSATRSPAPGSGRGARRGSWRGRDRDGCARLPSRRPATQVAGGCLRGHPAAIRVLGDWLVVSPGPGIQDPRFPMLKTQDAFSFEAQPDLDRDAVLQVLDCRFVAEAAT
ncbi:MAG: hypothetical protein OXQ29_08325 [Rhodospirillaceae bacterium]|nr:hypothetical protein [Rhodospirillaceae bacterium]